MSNKKLLALATGAALLAGAQGASAGVTASQDAQYSITLAASCEFTVQGNGFGTYDLGAPDLAKEPAGKVDARCSADVPYEILFNGGQNQDLGMRRMSDGTGTNFIVYDLFWSGDTTVALGDNTDDASYVSTSPYAGAPIAAKGTGSWQSFAVLADVLINTTSAPGTYTDNVAVTIAF